MTSENDLQKTKKDFRPRARIMELLGEQLIKNHTLALFELIKNSYDADASNVSLLLLNIDEDGGEIEIQDDGDGMDFNTVTNIWMEPAHGHKGESRAKGIRTEKGRLPIGEKGVGRFAVHRLGTQIELVTRAKDSAEVHVKINWSDLEQHKYLDEAKIDIKERVPETFLGDSHGTRITISNLKQKWRRGDIRKLYRSVLGMTSGKVDKSSETGFSVNFSLEPDKKWLDGFFDPDTARDQSMFRLTFEMDDHGLSYEYSFHPLESIKADYPGLVDDRSVSATREYSEFFTKSPPDEDGWKKRNKRPKRPILGASNTDDSGLGIGPLKGSIIAFDLDREVKDRYLKDEMSGLSEFLKDQGGIRVYRDDLRVYNYGEPGDDWLGLDHRRIQRPTGKLSNQLMLGEVHLELEHSFNLKEKTNREGFIENAAYNELQYAMICILTEFEAERNKDKKVLRSVLSIPPGKPGNEPRKKKTTDELLNDLKATVHEKKLEAEIGDLVDQVSKSYKETRDVLLSSAGAGLGLVTVFHELERGVRNLHAAISEGESVDHLKEQSKGLVSLLRGAMYMVSKGKMEKISASRLVSYACITQELRFKHHNIKFVNGFENLKDLDFEIKGVRRMLTATLVNLIDNAIYWASQTESDQSIIWVGPSFDLDGPSIIVADNGPGFVDSPEDIVQPFFSRKTDGMGIGLYYSDMMMKSHGGRLSFPERHAVETPKACDGAVIAMVFKGVNDAVQK
ncbi:ATP-binding protein [Microbulbifer sp. TRSA001]|uniref:ATP-binding protein n=1 Tax=unclassified Microbulbifer TaxID=2619833 RepID=UPI0024ACEE8C|nr:ATP-binding protein [Microbulbifer sp. VAAF005]WHI44649.1 ATP-binding protein [Microbulbifer sp. VAAF005]